MTGAATKPRCYLYHLDTTLYSELAVNLTVEGLSKIVHRALLGTGKFPSDRTTAVIAGRRGTMAECHARAMQSVQRTDFGARGLFHLLRVRDVVLPYTDPPTIAALDDAISHYLRIQLLAPDVQLMEPWPGAEWFFELNDEVPGFPPPTRDPVRRAIIMAMTRHLRIGPTSLAVSVFDAYGSPNWSRSLEGTFIARRNPHSTAPVAQENHPS